MGEMEAGVRKANVEAMLRREQESFQARNPRSLALSREARRHWPNGVPMHWMLDWGTPFPIFAARATGAKLFDVDGHEYDDFCFGDTGSMFGHSPAPIATAVSGQAQSGLTYMLPTEDVIAVGELLTKVFGLPYWQVATTATDANRFVLRWCRAITQRPNILIFNGCYHGSVDDTFVRLQGARPILRKGVLGQVYDLTQHTRVIEFNDIDALEKALAPGDVACVITEPALTNIGMVLPKPGFLKAMRQATSRAGTLLVIDETHTISAAYGGYTRSEALEPDFLVVGKPIAGGVPCAVFGFTAEVEAKMRQAEILAGPGYSGMGTTLSANALQLHAMRANLEHVMTEAAYAHMLPLSDELAKKMAGVIAKHGLPWHVSNVGARAEFVCAPDRPSNGTEAQAAMHHELELAIHLFLINRGLIIAPFHNMTLVSPATSAQQVGRLIEAVDQCLGQLTH
jgi:glutamate-1-semialdehyde 2,1-aminomutase